MPEAAVPPTQVALLLTILSVLLTLGFLTALVLALLLILKPLESIRGMLEQVAFGVRAIEKQAEPLGGQAGPAVDALRATGERVDGVARRMRALGGAAGSGKAPGRAD